VPADTAARDPDWTVETAAAWFTESGIPTTPAQLAGIIAQLPGLRPVGRAPSGPQGGVGKHVYKMSELMKLHARLAEWLVP
jgi:hypothetical protein